MGREKCMREKNENSSFVSLIQLTVSDVDFCLKISYSSLCRRSEWESIRYFWYTHTHSLIFHIQSLYQTATFPSHAKYIAEPSARHCIRVHRKARETSNES